MPYSEHHVAILKRRMNALIKVVEYTCFNDTKEFHDYMNWCDENKYDPHAFQGLEHVYALALLGMGKEFNCYQTECRRCQS